jgi:hypothetical protein
MSESWDKLWYRFSALLAFWAKSIVWYSKKHTKGTSFGNQICFRPQERGKETFSRNKFRESILIRQGPISRKFFSVMLLDIVCLKLSLKQAIRNLGGGGRSENAASYPNGRTLSELRLQWMQRNASWEPDSHSVRHVTTVHTSWNRVHRIVPLVYIMNYLNSAHIPIL